MDFNIDGRLFPDIYTLLTQWGATLILFLVFKKYLYKPVVNLLDRRATKMQEDLADAKKERELAQAQHQKANETYQQAVETGSTMVEESRRQAEMVKTDIVKEAKAQAQHNLEMAQGQIESERRAMLQDVHNEIVDVALAATHRLLEKEVDEEDQRAAISQMLAQINQE